MINLEIGGAYAKADENEYATLRGRDGNHDNLGASGPLCAIAGGSAFRINTMAAALKWRYGSTAYTVGFASVGK